MKQTLFHNTIHALALLLLALVSLVNAKDLEPELVTTTDGHYYAVEMSVTENRDNSGYLYPDYVTPFYGTTAGEPYIVVLGSNYDYKGGYLTVVAPSDNDRLYVTGYLYTNNTAGEYVDFKVYNGDISQTHSLILNGTTCNGQNATNQCLVSIDPITSSGNRVTFYYKTTKKSSGNKESIRLTVYHVKSQPVTLNQTTGGTVSANKTSAKKGETIYLYAAPESGYMLTDYTVKDANNNVVSLTNFTSSSFNSTFAGSANFTMPISAVTVTPKWTNNLTAAGGLFVNMRSLGSQTLNIPTGVKSLYIYDDGGKDGKCSMNASSNLTLVAPEGTELQLSGTGPSGNATLYYSRPSGGAYLPGGNIGTISIGSNTTKLTYQSTASSESELSNGFALIATVVVPQYEVNLFSVTGGEISVDKLEAGVGETVTMTATPASNYLPKSILVRDAQGKSVSVTASPSNKWFDGETYTYTFTMPASNVSIMPSWTNNFSAASGLSVNMPVSGSAVVDIPETVQSFMVYDDGGKDASYTWNANGTLTLRAPEGARLSVVGTVSTRSSDMLSIYDGAVASGSPLKTVGGSAQTVSAISSTGNVMTLSFESTGGNTSYSVTGLELTVSVVLNASEGNAIVIANVAGGEVTSSGAFAAAGEMVMLTATPAEGYLPVAMRVKDAQGRFVNVTASQSNKWYDGNPYTYTFAMPASDVTVTPSWSSAPDYRSAKVPVSGLEILDISGNVSSFMVYDDGGSATCEVTTNKKGYLVASGGCYSEGANGGIVLNAPAGYLIQASGMVKTANSNIKLTIYDGDNTNAVKLLNGLYGNYATGALTSTGNSMTVYFDATGCQQTSCRSDGFSLTVKLIKPSYAAVSFASVDKKLTATIDGNYTGTDAIEFLNTINVNSVEFDRTFSTNGNGYSTIVLPFPFYGSNLEGVDAILQFEGIGKDEKGDTAVTVSYAWCRQGFSSECGSLSGNLRAYTPYLVKVSAEHIIFNGAVTILPSQAAEVRKGDWVFRGTLQKKVWEKGDPDIGKVWGFAATDEYVKVGDFAKIGPGGWIRPLRSYIAYEPVAGGSNGAGRAAAVASIEDLPDRMPVVIVTRDENNEEHTMTIGTLNVRTGEFKMRKDYDLKGRKLNAKPKARGAYYGKKVIKK